MSITAEDIIELHRATGRGVLECKRVLEESQGNGSVARAKLRDPVMRASRPSTSDVVRNFDQSRTTLLVGNGPNRLSESAVSWQDVLNQLTRFARHHVSTDGKPLPLLFEEVALSMEKHGRGDVGTLKREISSIVGSLTPNSIHGRIMALGVRHVLTTNYDHCLEMSLTQNSDREHLESSLLPENKFNMYRCRDVTGTSVWHIHGDIEVPRSITLGYDHYVGYLARLQDYLAPKNGRASDLDEGASPFLQGVNHFDDLDIPYSWVDVFLRNDVHIIGLGLGFEEIDLWWLIMAKERLRNRRQARNAVSPGQTVFHHFQQFSSSEPPPPHISMLESIGVTVRTHYVEQYVDWEFEKGFHSLLGEMRGLMKAT